MITVTSPFLRPDTPPATAGVLRLPQGHHRQGRREPRGDRRLGPDRARPRRGGAGI